MTRPNVLLFMIDQQHAAALRAWGGTVARTPNIDALAARGRVFTRAYSNFPVCMPSRMSMLTGRLASCIGAYDNACELPATTPTLAHCLRFLGYHTVLSGKMHFIGPDLLHGFEHRLTPELYSADLMTMPDWTGEDDDFATDAFEALSEAGPVARTVQMDYDEEVAFHARQQLCDFARAEDDRPVFLAVSFTHPHEPFLCLPECWDLYEGADIPLPAVPARPLDAMDPHSRRAFRHYNLGQPGITEQHVRAARRAFYGSMSYADGLIGSVLGTLRHLGLEDETIIVLASDHGEMLGERGLWFKKVFFENAVRVPLLFAGPGITPGRSDAPVSLVDLLPTLVGLAGGEVQDLPLPDLDGQSLLPALTGSGRTLPARPVFAEMTCEGVNEPVMMIVAERFKFIFSASLPPLLFDLGADPLETRNLAGQPGSAETEARMRHLAEARWGDLGVLRSRIIRSQQQRHFVRAALEQGAFCSWDESPVTGPGARYLRRGKSYNAWNYSGVARLRARATRTAAG